MSEEKNKTFWLLRKRVWLTTLLLLLVYLVCMTQFPGETRFTEKTTGIESPVFRNGKVDYFAEFDKRYNHRLHPATDNGFRDLLAACGPRILEQSALMDAVPWSHLSTHAYYLDQWQPLCERLEIDPAPRPKYLDSLDFESYFAKLKKLYAAGTEQLPDFLEEDPRDIRRNLVLTPVDLKQYPKFANWLADRSSVLDLFNESVRKPIFFCPHAPHENSSLYAILLPDVQASRSFARDLQVRIADRVFRGDIEGAWQDTLSMYLLSRKHYQNEPFFVTQLVGFAVEEIGNESLRLILEHGSPTAEQLEKIAADLDSLPTLESCFNELGFAKLAMYDMLYEYRGKILFCDLDGNFVDYPSQVSAELPLDYNIAGERLAQLWKNSDLDDLAKEKYRPKGSEEREEFERLLDAYDQFKVNHERSMNLNSLAKTGMLLPIQSRSRYAAAKLFLESAPPVRNMVEAYDRTTENFEKMRVDVACERHRLKYGETPDAPSKLVPEFLDRAPAE